MQFLWQTTWEITGYKSYPNATNAGIWLHNQLARITTCSIQSAAVLKQTSTGVVIQITAEMNKPYWPYPKRIDDEQEGLTARLVEFPYH